MVLRGGAVAGELAGDEVAEGRLLEVLADHMPGAVRTDGPADHTPGAVPAGAASADDRAPGAVPDDIRADGPPDDVPTDDPAPETGGKAPTGQEDPR